MHPSGGQYGSPGWPQQPPDGPGGPPPAAPGPYGPPPGPYGPDPWGQSRQPQQPYGQPPAGYPGQPPQGQPQQVALPAQAGSGMGRLVIEAKASWLFWPLRAFGKPQVSINGGLVTTQWGANVYDLPDGQHNIHAVVNYLWKVGEAYAVEPVHAGQQTVLYYKAPLNTWSAGALDGNPGGYPGMTGAVAALCVLGVLIVGLILLIVLGNILG